VLLSEELPEPDSPPKKIVVMGEPLLGFRDTRGRVGIIDQHCPHRGANLWLGRNEEYGIRCVYHGWKFDAIACGASPSPEGAWHVATISIGVSPSF
jgi:phenylpropionate dioxygenase-like ring-hydroxylating dioxygenase large terminal subunit